MHFVRCILYAIRCVYALFISRCLALLLCCYTWVLCRLSFDTYYLLRVVCRILCVAHFTVCVGLCLLTVVCCMLLIVLFVVVCAFVVCVVLFVMRCVVFDVC